MLNKRMELAVRKSNFIEAFSKLEDENVVQCLETLLNSIQPNKNWIHELEKVEKDEIKLGLIQADANEFISHQKVLSKFDKWH